MASVAVPKISRERDKGREGRKEDEERRKRGEKGRGEQEGKIQNYGVNLSLGNAKKL